MVRGMRASGSREQNRAKVIRFASQACASAMQGCPAAQSLPPARRLCHGRTVFQLFHSVFPQGPKQGRPVASQRVAPCRRETR